MIPTGGPATTTTAPTDTNGSADGSSTATTADVPGPALPTGIPGQPEPGVDTDGSSVSPWWLLIPLIPAIPAVLWLLAQQGSSNPPIAVPPAPRKPEATQPAPNQPVQPLQPNQTEPVQPVEPSQSAPSQPGQTAPGKSAQQPAKPGERQQIKSVPSGATELGKGVERFVA